mmetsp:Transcript_25596/g.87945  ORF Transcript_25596/g.87945 Transcript_25596/m.87945 type:complete len:211 (-) Transcript_25596:8-640(-)
MLIYAWSTTRNTTQQSQRLCTPNGRRTSGPMPSSRRSFKRCCRGRLTIPTAGELWASTAPAQTLRARSAGSNRPRRPASGSCCSTCKSLRRRLWTATTKDTARCPSRQSTPTSPSSRAPSTPCWLNRTSSTSSSTSTTTRMTNIATKRRGGVTFFPKSSLRPSCTATFSTRSCAPTACATALNSGMRRGWRRRNGTTTLNDIHLLSKCHL